MPVMFTNYISFHPPLPTRHYPHLGDRVLVGWIMVTEKSLREVKCLRMRRREGGLHDLHNVTVTPWSEDYSGYQQFSDAQLELMDCYNDRLLLWISAEGRTATPGMHLASESKWQKSRHGVRLWFLPAMAELKPSEAPQTAADGNFFRPLDLKPSKKDPINWGIVRLMMREEPACEAIHRGLQACCSDHAEVRRACRDAAEAGRKARQAACDARGSLDWEAHLRAATLDAKHEQLEIRADVLSAGVREELLGRLVFAGAHRTEHICNCVDFVRTIASDAPRRSLDKPVRTIAQTSGAQWGTACIDEAQPLLSLGLVLCTSACCVDYTDVSLRDHLESATVCETSPPEQRRHADFIPAEACVVSGVTAETSAVFNACLLPELAWNVFMWDDMDNLKDRIGYAFDEAYLVREALTQAAYGARTAGCVDGGGRGGACAFGCGRCLTWCECCVCSNRRSGDATTTADTPGEDDYALSGVHSPSFFRLQGLGRTVLLVIASQHAFYTTKATTPPEELEHARDELVSVVALDAAGRSMTLDEFALRPSHRLDRSCPSTGKARLRPAHVLSPLMMARAVETLAGGVYLNAGLERARAFFEQYILPPGRARVPAWRRSQWTDVPAVGDADLRLSAGCARLSMAVGIYWEGNRPALRHALLHPSACATATSCTSYAAMTRDEHTLLSRGRDAGVEGEGDGGSEGDDETCDLANNGVGIKRPRPPPVWQAVPPPCVVWPTPSAKEGVAAASATLLPHQFERLAWLGDVLLALAVHADVYHRYSRESHMQLIERVDAILSAKVLNAAAELIDLDNAILVDHVAIFATRVPRTTPASRTTRASRTAFAAHTTTGEAHSDEDTLLAEAFEAVACAVCLDGDFGALQLFAREHLIHAAAYDTYSMRPAIVRVPEYVDQMPRSTRRDLEDMPHPRNLLASLVHKMRYPPPEYVPVSADANGTITVECRINLRPASITAGPDFRTACAAAARIVYDELEAARIARIPPPMAEPMWPLAMDRRKLLDSKRELALEAATKATWPDFPVAEEAQSGVVLSPGIRRETIAVTSVGKQVDVGHGATPTVRDAS